MFEFPKICRLCTQNNNINYTLNAIESKVSLTDKLISIAPNAYKINDNLPNYICENCYEKLNQSYNFQKQIIQSHKIYTSFLDHIQNVETNKNIKTECFVCIGDDIPISTELKQILNSIIPNKTDNSFNNEENNYVYDQLINSEIKIETDEIFESDLTESSIDIPIRKTRGRPKKTIKIKNPTEKCADISCSDNDSENIKVKRKKHKKITRIGAVQSDLDPNEYTYQLPYDPSVKITYISNAADKFHFCKNCNKQYSDFSSLRKHFSYHSTVKIFQCDLCDYESFTKRCMDSHKIVHLQFRSETCKECGKSFKSKDRLHRHMYCHMKRFICEICGKEFSHSAMLRKHVAHVHNSERNSICNICGFAAKSQEYLNRHMNKHNNSDENKIECPKCKRLLKTRNSFKIHMRRHENDRKFQCSMCDKKYVVKSQLDIHFRIHTGYKPFTCSYCGKQFRKADPYKNHLRIHTNERPFICEYCNKGFTQKVSLQVHLRLHTGERPFSCKDCGKSFVQSSVHKLHVKKYHPESLNQD